MTDNCPLCGNTLNADMPLTICLETNTASRAGRSVKLNPTHAELLQALVDGGVRYQSQERLFDAIYGASYPGDIDEEIIRVFMSKMRPNLKELGVTIENSWGVGWRLGFDV